MLQGEQINNEILVGLSSEVAAIREQLQMIMTALYPPMMEAENTSEPTALGADNNE
jgi:DNA polymerase III alpha subunit (gram-positive type)